MIINMIHRLPHLSLYIKEPSSISHNNGNTEQPDHQPTDNVNNNLNISGFSNLSLLSQNSDDDARVNRLLYFLIFIFIQIFIIIIVFTLQTEFSEPWDSSRWEHLLPVANKVQNQSYVKPVNRNKSFSERLDPLLGKMDEHFIIKT